MLLKSLIKDDSKMTIHIDDVQKGFKYTGTIQRNSLIEIPEEAYWYKEVQEAIKLGFAVVDGEVPTQAPSVHVAQVKVLKNPMPFKVTLDFLKNYAVADGGIIEVPIDSMGHPEVRSAMKMGWLVDESAPAAVVATLSDEDQAIMSARGKKTVKSAKGAVKAKKVSAHDDVTLDTENKEDPTSLFAESQVHIPGETSKKVMIKDEPDSLFAESPVRIPGESPKKAGAPAPEAPKDVVNPDDLFERWWSEDEGK